MLPTEDAAAVGEEMQRRFGLRDWQFTLSATDANRFVIRIARQITGRSKILVHNHCYHGSVDETVATLVDGEVRPREGSVGPPVDVAETTRVVEINDLDGLERELAHGDVACVLIEPALTNIGIVLADDGYHERVRELCTASRDAAGDRRDPHALLRARRLHRAPTGSSPTFSRSASRSAAGSRPAPTASAPRSPTGSSPTPSGRRPTSAGSAARWPATRSRWPRFARRSPRCSPRRRSST